MELLSTDEMGEADRRTIAGGVAGYDLMLRAGAAVADHARQAMPEGAGRIAVLCGPGNNGGDGFVAARLLREMGFEVTAGLFGDRTKLSGDAARAAMQWTGKIVSAALVDLNQADLVIDALFGAGLQRDIEGRVRAIVERLNGWRAETGKPVVAVDVPTGIDGSTGQVRGVCVEADVTVTFFRCKPGHRLLPGRLKCGRVVCEDIGIAPAVLGDINPPTFDNVPALWIDSVPLPRPDGHKYARGHAIVMSGPATQTGAARLAGHGALRAGAGLVTVLAQREALAANAAHLTAIMLRPCDSAEELSYLLSDSRLNALLLGPGFGVGAETCDMARAALAAPTGPAVVLDADALTSFEEAADNLAECIGARDRAVVLTPHEGEFSRLFDGQGNLRRASSEEDDSFEMPPVLDKLSRVRAAAAACGAVVLLKGPDTVVAEPSGRASIASNGPPWLATAGSGDVLAGMITGLLAQGMDGFEAASAAVWMHGAAAAAFGPGLVSEDIPGSLPQVWRQLACAGA